MNIEKYLLEIGIKPHLKGFYFLADAIRLVTKDVAYLKKITTRLYPSIAEKHGETTSGVERAIRNAINTSETEQKSKPSQFIGEHSIKIKLIK